MREILFRGKTPSDDEYTDCGEWVEGFYTRFNGKEHRIYSGYAETDCGDYYPDWQNVRPETVGQYTGLTDKNGKKIFEGDIIEYEGANKNRAAVVFAEGAFSFSVRGKYNTPFADCQYGVPSECCEVIGNIHDNPELLK